MGRVKIGTFPGATTLTLDCRGRGCPRPRKLSATGAKRLHRLLRELDGRRYRAGDQLFLTLSAPGYRPSEPS